MRMPPSIQWVLFGFFVVGVEVCNGALFDAINGLITHSYFAAVLMRGSISWIEIVQHGMLEGAVIGVVGTILFSVYTLIISRRRVVPLHLFPYPLLMFPCLLVCWLIGGVDGLIASYYLPEQLALPPTPPAQQQWGWVGGSIYGLYIGSVLSLLIVCAKWRKDYLKQPRY